MNEGLSSQQLLQIANEFGTPVYIYHAERIATQYGKLQKAFANCPARFFYACKSLTNINILKYVNSLGAGLDCVSINEVRLGLMAGFSEDRILFTPNCVDFDEILAAKELGVHINIDNISILEQFGKQIWQELSGLHQVESAYHGGWKFQNLNRACRQQVWHFYSPDQAY
jgi:diaminopimelate decarboxylase